MGETGTGASEGLARVAGHPLALVLALLLGALAAFWPGQSALPPSDRDEARFVQATKQMLETGDFGDIRFQDAPRHKKPVGIYWLQAASAALAGGAEAPVAAYRVPSWLGAALAVALTGWAVAPLIGWKAAAAAAAMLGVSVLLHVEARIAKTDAALLAMVVTAMGALARLALDPARRWMARLFWAATGVGILLKGPVVLIPAAGALGWRTVAARSLSPLRGLRPVEGLAIAAAIAAPWLIAITLATDGAFWAESLGRDMLAKLASGQESHGAPPGLYLALAWGTFWPMAVLAIPAAPAIWRRRRETPVAFLLGWLVPTWLLFELVATKLPHYVLPAYPALAALIAAAVFGTDAPSAPGRLARQGLLALWGLPALALALGAAAAAPAIEGRVVWPALALGLAALAPLRMAAAALWRWRLRAFALWAGGGAVLTYAAAFGFALPALETGFVAPRLAEAAAMHRCAPGPVAIAGYSEPSAVVALGTDTLLTGPAEAAAALMEGRAALAFIEARDLDAFAQAVAASGAAVTPVAAVAGFNYSKGRSVGLTLFVAEGCDAG